MKNVYKFRKVFILLLLVMAQAAAMGQAIVTDYIINITDVAATCGYTVTTGGTNSTGVCIGATANPVKGASNFFAGPTGTGSQEVLLTGLTANTVYHARPYATNDGLNYVYGNDIQFQTFPTGSASFPYQCEIRNDHLVDANTLQYTVYIKSTTTALLSLNNYQLGVEVSNIETSAGTLTGNFVSGTSDLAAGFQPATNLLFRMHNAHWDAVVAGPPASSLGELIPQSPSEKRIGTFQIVHHSVSGGPATPFPTGVQLNLLFDFDVLGKTIIYAISNGTTSGTPANSTVNTAHIPNEINPNHFYPSNNYACNAANWKGTTDHDWMTATNWVMNPSSLGTLPISSTYAFIEGTGSGIVNYPIVSTRSTPACGALNIESASSVTISSTGDLTVNGTLINPGGTSGLTIKSGGSLIQSTASISATVEREIAAWALPNHGWHFLSSPVAGQAISPNFTAADADYDFYAWYESANLWVNYKNTSVEPTWNTANGSLNFTPGKGYLVEYAATGTKTFSGTLNNDNISVSNLVISSGANKGWHLLGNPFTSALTYSGFSLTNINGTAKIWKESTAAYIDVRSSVASEVIPALNGFMVEVTAGHSGSNSITIPTTARVHDGTTTWYKSSGGPSITLVANDLSGQTAQESIIQFDSRATAGFDPAFDSHFLEGYAPKFYSVAGNDLLSVNVLPEEGGTVQIPFTFIKNDGGNFNIEAKTISDIYGPVILSDLKTNSSQDLSIDPVYAFASSAGDTPNRFILKFSSVGIQDSQKDIALRVYSSGNNIIVVGQAGNTQGNILVYNMLGQIIHEQKLSGGSMTKICLDAHTGYYLVKVVTSDQTSTSKVFISHQ